MSVPSQLRTVAPTSSADPDAAWDAWVAAQPAAHLLQTSRWAALKARFGWQPRRVVVHGPDGGVRAGASLLLRRAMGLTMAYVPRGPLVDWHDAPLVAELLDALRVEARCGGAAVLKLEPELADSGAHRALLASHGLTPSRQAVQPPSTIVVDIGRSEAAILQGMKSKWRYNVRLAERKEVTVRTLVQADFPSFDGLMHATGQRDGFATHSPAYFAAAYDLLVPEHAVYLLAEYAGEPLATIVVAITGSTAWYLWGASSDRERNRMPNHALQWAGMCWARAHGATRYDFWGIPDPIGQVAAALRGGDGSGTPADAVPVDLDALPHEGLWGVYRFKQGFGGDVVRAVGAWDMAVEPVRFALYQAGLTAREIAHSQQIRELERWLNGKRTPSPAATHATPDRNATTPRAPRATAEPVSSPSTWRALLAALPDPHVLQSWEWGDVKAQTGWHAERLSADLPGGRTALQFLWRQPVAGAPLRMGYIPKGPVLDWSNEALVDEVLALIEAHARARRCIFVKIDPDVSETSSEGRLVLHALERRGWRYSADQVQFKNTAYSDLTVGEAQLLAAMKSKWRYNVRLAEKRGICVRSGSEADLPAFYALYTETGGRDGFLIRPFDYYDITWRTFLAAQADPASQAGGALLLAEHPEESQPLAGIFLLRYGTQSWYFYGASGDRRRRDMPNYLLQWEALRWSIAQGCTRYDWWGAPTDPDDAGDSMQGVWQFKQGFGAELQRQIGAWDFPVSATLYRLYTATMPSVLEVMRRIAR